MSNQDATNTVDKVVAKAFNDKDINPMLVAYIEARVKELCNTVSKKNNGSLTFLDSHQLGFLQGFIDGTCLMLVMIKEITQKDYEDIITNWDKELKVNEVLQ